MNKYRNWDLLDEMPDGWEIDKSVGSPMHGYEFVTNKKSLVTGKQKRALLRVLQPQKMISFDDPNKHPEPLEAKTEKPAQIVDAVYVKTVNELARSKFKQQMLNDIMCDMMICEIEGWCKMEYINEIRRLVLEIGSKSLIEA